MKRQAKNKRLLANILITVEGETEEYYFRGFISKFPKQIQKQINIKVIKVKGGNASVILKNAIKEKDNLGIKEAYVVLDTDNCKSIGQLIQTAKNNGIHLIRSHLCFELWFVLHYDFTTRSFEKCEAIEKLLKEKYIKNYQKASPSIYEKLYLQTAKAIKNSKKLEEWNHQNFEHEWEFSPYTNIHKLIERLQEIEQE